MFFVSALIWYMKLPAVGYVCGWVADRVLEPAEDFDYTSTTHPRRPVE